MNLYRTKVGKAKLVLVNIDRTRHTSITLSGFLWGLLVVKRKYCEQMSEHYLEKTKDGSASGA